MGLESKNKLERILRLQGAMSDTGIDAILLNYSRSLFYYAGTTHPSFLIVTREDYCLMVLRGLKAVRKETWLSQEKIFLEREHSALRQVLEEKKVLGRRIGMELDILPARQYFQICELLSPSSIVDISGLILKQRMIKDEDEVECTREACRIVHKGHERILKVLKPGMTELELSAGVEDAHRRSGHEGLYFIRQFDFFMGRGPLAAGENTGHISGRVQSISGVGLSPSIPMGASRKKIRAGETIVVDIPAIHKGYHCDQSRTYVAGKATKGCVHMHSAMRDIADRVIEDLKPGLSCGETYDLAFKYAGELGVEPYFMRLGDIPDKVPFVGHGIGIELNEPPLIRRGSREVLEDGMIVALELEMCGPAREVVKLEDTLLITPGGAEVLTLTPRELFQV